MAPGTRRSGRSRLWTNRRFHDGDCSSRKRRAADLAIRRSAQPQVRGSGLRVKVLGAELRHNPIATEMALATRSGEFESVDGKEDAREGRKNPKDYVGRTWITRPQPGIDRVSSAWLILRYIDSHAKFAFDKDPGRHPDAIPFDMFNAGGFGHVGNDCTFETLVKSFSIKDSRLRLVAQAIHDADLADEHFGRIEALGIDRVLDGWNKQGMANEEVLRRGMEMIDGLYNGIR